MESKHHVVVTWPKTRRLEAYLAELYHADVRGLLVNFRVPSLPKWPELLLTRDHGESGFPYGADVRCYHVWDGQIRGFLTMVDARHLEEGQVLDPTGFYWPAGFYLVRAPHWHPVEPQPMRGFQSWRWYTPAPQPA